MQRSESNGFGDAVKLAVCSCTIRPWLRGGGTTGLGGAAGHGSSTVTSESAPGGPGPGPPGRPTPGPARARTRTVNPLRPPRRTAFRHPTPGLPDAGRGAAGVLPPARRPSAGDASGSAEISADEDDGSGDASSDDSDAIGRKASSTKAGTAFDTRPSTRRTAWAPGGVAAVDNPPGP